MFGQVHARLKAYEKSVDKRNGYDISTPEARRRALWHFRWIDHGILRGFWTNLFEIAPGVWRSNQPDGARIHKYKDMGIKTVLNLRGTTKRSPFLFEAEACEETGLTMVSIALAARKPVEQQVLVDLLNIFDTIEKPFVMHCKSGADRAGLASAFYLLHTQGASIDEAKKQLSFKYLHIRRSKTGVLDHLLDMYGTAHAETGISIYDWVSNHYDPEELKASYAASTAKG